MKYNLSKALPEGDDQINWFYNGLDCAITYEIWKKLKGEIKDKDVLHTYEGSLAKQAPVMEMELRGLRIDQITASNLIARMGEDEKRVTKLFDQLCYGILGDTFNPNSPAQLKDLFYERIKFKPVNKRNAKGDMVPSVDGNAMQTFLSYDIAVPFVNMIMCIKDLRKQLSFLKKSVAGEARYTGAFNIAGTKTGRLASMESDFGGGGNLQNSDRRLRRCFTADSGCLLVNIDLEQADSRNVGAILHELYYETHGTKYADAYLDACESGDLHTEVAKLVWPKIRSRSDADALFFRNDSYRQTAKKLGHGTNYKGAPNNMAKHTAIPVPVVKEFQRKYFDAFPAMLDWHEWVAQQLASYPGKLTTLYRRPRTFLDRGENPKTIRDAVAFCPQSMTAHQIDASMLAVWRKYPEVQLLLQMHDNILFQLPETKLDLIPDIMQVMTKAHTLTLKGDRTFYVPVEAKIGFNWGDYDQENNPKGLKVFS